MNTLTYVYDNKIYLNLTNKCSNNCEFCIRHTGDGVLDYYLWLDKEPTAEEVIEEHGMKPRLNTNGQAGLISGPDTAMKLKGLIDTVSISLNASDAEKYNKICHCKFNEEGFYEMLRFAVNCKKEGIRTVMSVVDVIGNEEIEKCRAVAKQAGVEFRVRTYVQSYEQ